MSKKPSLVKGTRDFGPKVMLRRKHILNTIENVYKKYGFLPIETPAMEQLETLTGKYGDEGDQLLFKILNSGDFASGVNAEMLNPLNKTQLLNEISEKGLRYDLTVPLARFVSMNRNDIAFPFKRYQMQPVWRADRPQKGRYREFWQCDADVLGSDSLMNEADLLNIASEVFDLLGPKISIQINNRKILEAIAEKFDLQQHFKSFVILIDKLDKVDFDSLAPEFGNLGLNASQMAELKELLVSFSFEEASIQTILSHLPGLEKAMIGCNELSELLGYCQQTGITDKVSINLSLARGLDYYTGCIIEIKAMEVKMGSISGGGRYDDLTGVFGFEGVSGVGISFGIDRIYDVMEELKMFEDNLFSEVKALFCHFDNAGRKHNYQLADKLRKDGIACEVYPDTKKIARQFEYADKKGITMVLMSGETEINTGTISYKNLQTKQQGSISASELTVFLNSSIH